MKRTLLLFSALMLSCIALWAHDVEIDGIYYNLDKSNKTAHVTYEGDKYYSSSYKYGINIPETITYFLDTYTVTSISAYAFYFCDDLTSVTIPNSVTSIGDYAFSYCSGLTSVSIPNSVTSIGEDAFYNCSGLTSVTIPNSVTSIGSYAFSGCSGLTSVTIPNSVTSIGYSAFENCSGLTSVTIPNSVTSIGSSAFSGCSGLTSVIWNAKNGKDLSLSSDPFSGIRSQITYFVLGNAVEYIPAYLCYGMSNLKEVTIPNSVTSIAASAFRGCSGFNTISIGESVTYIGSSAFAGCSGLNTISIGESVTYIATSAFDGCSGLISVLWNAKNLKSIDSYDENPFYKIRRNIFSFTFGNKVEYIPLFLCYEMNNLKEITIPNSVTSIGAWAFEGCGVTSVTIAESVTCINYDAFERCYGLTKVNYLGTVDKWAEIAFNSFESNPTFYAKKLYINNELLTDVKITEADSIYDNVFVNCKSIKSVEIGNSVKYIGLNVFYDCSGLTSVLWNVNNCEFYNNTDSPFDDSLPITSFAFGNEVEHIPPYVCRGLKNLKEITIPNSVTSIGGHVFSGCSGLKSVLWNAKNVADDECPFDYNTPITSFTFGNEVKYIPSYLFNGLNYLKEITIPNSVTSIGGNAFQNCGGLTKVNYLGTVEEWAELDFYNNSSNPTYCAKKLYINNELLTDVKITEAKSIKDYAFYNCNSIKSVEIGNSVTSIGYEAFYGCSGLTSVTIPNSVTTIGSGAFKNCSGLTSVTIPNRVTSIYSGAFSGCSGLTSVTIPNSVTSIGWDAFKNCSELKSVSIGENVNTIGSGAFAGCDNLKKITMYPTTVPSVYENSFAHYNAYLYVPCAVYEDYDLDDVFGNFKYVKCIAADEVDAPDKVEIDVDNDNNATITWPSTDGAKSYELEITKNGKVFCTLLFNEDGQLTSIDFGNRAASVGFQFTVTGLNGASKYNYSMVAMDKKGNELQSYKGTFTTNGYVPGPGEEDEPSAIIETLADANITISNGLITVADADFSIYNLAGQNVTALNGNLLPGVYMVSLNGNIAKVMVK